MLAYAVRRLPYTVRSIHAALQQVHVSYEEAAHGLGAQPVTTFWRITRPLIAPGVIAGGVVAFVTSAVGLSSTMVLVPTNNDGPLSFGIYVYMQSALGRGPAAALGLRPDAIRLTGSASGQGNRVAGRIVSSLYFGARVRYLVAADGGANLRVDVPVRDHRQLAAGERVDLEYLPSEAVLLPADVPP